MHIDNGIAFGITIGGLTTQSCNATWVPSATPWNLTDASFKLMELDSLSIYWNHMKKDQLFGGLNLGDLAVSVYMHRICKAICNNYVTTYILTLYINILYLCAPPSSPNDNL